MAKSRMATFVFAACWSAAGSAQPAATAEDAIAGQRVMVTGAVAPRCPERSEENEIVVCGSRDDDRYRLPLPVEAAAGPGSRAGGEQMAALQAGQGRCTPVGSNPQCNGGLSVFAAIAKLVEGMRNVSERGDE